MELGILVRGILIGLMMCAPVGPVGLFCVRKTIARGRAAGLASVLGASVVDGLYCALAGFGITFVASFLARQYVWVELLGGGILILLGIKLFFSPVKERQGENNQNGVFRAFTSAFIIMLANPMPILVFTATFTALGIQGWKGDYVSTAALVAGVFMGSALWAPILVGLVSAFGDRYSPKHIRLVNRISGGIIAGVGATLVLSILLGSKG
jgi:threonine/homoserine/homoserine lactone efflux protein